eukprot:RCo053829
MPGQVVCKLVVDEPFLSLLVSGRKTVEGRIYRPERYDHATHLQADEHIFEILAKRTYPSFAAMLTSEGLDKVMPGTATVEAGVAVYHSFPGYKEQELTHGVIALRLRRCV